MSKLRTGHAPEHVRQAFTDALDAFASWDGKGQEPKVVFEVNFVPTEITISQACGLVRNCNDILPSSAYGELGDVMELPKRRTYAACAQALRAALNKKKVTA